VVQKYPRQDPLLRCLGRPRGRFPKVSARSRGSPRRP